MGTCFQRRNPDSGILARKNQYLLMGGQILLPNLLILRNSYITWCCGPGYGGPWPWELRILSKVNPTKRALGFFENPKIPPPGFWPSDDSENRFGFSNGHVGSSVIQNDGSRTNSAVRTSRWVCRPLGTNFSPLSTPTKKSKTSLGPPRAHGASLLAHEGASLFPCLGSTRRYHFFLPKSPNLGFSFESMFP